MVSLNAKRWLKSHLLHLNICLYKLHQPRESHERHGKDAGGDQRYRGAFHAFRYADEVDMLADAGEDDEREGEADGDAGRIDDSLTDVAAIDETLADDLQRDAEDTAVCRNQRKENAECGI